MTQSELLFWLIILSAAATLYCFNHPRQTRRLWDLLILGYTRTAYTELYTAGAITAKEYLAIMKQIDEEYDDTHRTHRRHT